MGFAPNDWRTRNLAEEQWGYEQYEREEKEEEEEEEDEEVVLVAGERKGGEREGFIEREVVVFMMMANMGRSII